MHAPRSRVAGIRQDYCAARKTVMKWLTAFVAIGIGSAIIGSAAKAQPRPAHRDHRRCWAAAGVFAPLDLPIAQSGDSVSATRHRCR